MSSRSGLLASVMFAAIAFFASHVSAANGPVRAGVPSQPERVVGGEDPQLLHLLQQEELQLRAMRSVMPKYFAEAYRSYPQIPAGTLEAIAWSQSRWMPLQPLDTENHHNHMPTAYGVMGLYAGEGFTDQVTAASRLTGLSTQLIKTDSRANILAAAALLAQEIGRAGLGRNGVAPKPEQISQVLARYAGFTPMQGGNAIEDFARQSFAFDVLLSMDRGVNEKGAIVPERPIQWERAFAPAQLVTLRAPFVRLDVSRGRVDAGNYAIDPTSETMIDRRTGAGSRQVAGPDYSPAIWDPASPSNYTASRSAAIGAVTIHTTQGSYAGTISWFKNPAAQVSAHYVIRSSDGQVTQMVRNAYTAWHVRSHNSYTLGIEHEGYISNSSWYTTAMYNASSALVRNFCGKYSAIKCSSAYNGPASSGTKVLPDSVKIKGHQHYSGNDHTDPGIYWNWSRYYSLLNPAPAGTAKLLDTFESSVGHFNTSPAYSGSTTGISTASTALRYCSMSRNGSCSLQVKLVDNASNSASWAVRLLSGGGSPSANTQLTRANGKVGFWVYAGGTGMSVAVGVDDSDGTERSVSRSLAANTWTYVEWSLTDANQWDAWVGGNGAITASSVTLDAIWLYRAQTSYDVYVYIDDVRIVN